MRSRSRQTPGSTNGSMPSSRIGPGVCSSVVRMRRSCTAHTVSMSASIAAPLWHGDSAIVTQSSPDPARRDDGAEARVGEVGLDRVELPRGVVAARGDTSSVAQRNIAATSCSTCW